MNLASPWARRRLERSLTSRPLVYGGNRIELLRSGAEFFPRLLAAIDAGKFKKDVLSAPLASSSAGA